MTRCTKTIHVGPGHQSALRCVFADGPHHHHMTDEYGTYYEWSECLYDHSGQAFSTYFDLSPGPCEIHHAITGRPLEEDTQ